MSFDRFVGTRRPLCLVAVLALVSALFLPTATAQDPPPVPDSPTGLSTQVSTDAVTLSWDDPGDDTISGYVILRRDKATQSVGVFSTVTADTGTSDTGYVDAHVRAGRRYVYRVQAINPAGISERSNWARGYTTRWLNSPERPAKPRGLTAETSHDQVTLSWNDPGDDTVAGYVILRRDKDTHDRGIFETLNPDTATTHTTYVDTTAQPDRRYIYRIKAINTAGHSKTAWTRGHTPAAPQPAPEPDPTPEPDPAAESDPAPEPDTDTADADAADNDPADADTTTLTPPAHTPRWVQGLAAAYTSHSSTDNGLAAPTNFRIDIDQAGSIPSVMTLRWDDVDDADGYEFYILATREINEVQRDWWVIPDDEDDNISVFREPLKNPSRPRWSALLGGFREGDTPSFATDHLIIAMSAYRDTTWGREWSDWRVAVLNFDTETVSYNLYDERDLYTLL